MLAVISSGVTSWAEAAFPKCCNGVSVCTGFDTRAEMLLRGKKVAVLTSFSAADLVLVSSGEGQMSCLSPYKINFVEDLVPFLLFRRLLSILLIGIIVCMSCSLILSLGLWALQSCTLQRLTCKAHHVDFMWQ